MKINACGDMIPKTGRRMTRSKSWKLTVKKKSRKVKKKIRKKRRTMEYYWREKEKRERNKKDKKKKKKVKSGKKEEEKEGNMGQISSFSKEQFRELQKQLNALPNNAKGVPQMPPPSLIIPTPTPPAPILHPLQLQGLHHQTSVETNNYCGTNRILFV